MSIEKKTKQNKTKQKTKTNKQKEHLNPFAGSNAQIKS